MQRNFERWHSTMKTRIFRYFSRSGISTLAQPENRRRLSKCVHLTPVRIEGVEQIMSFELFLRRLQPTENWLNTFISRSTWAVLRFTWQPTRRDTTWCVLFRSSELWFVRYVRNSKGQPLNTFFWNSRFYCVAAKLWRFQEANKSSASIICGPLYLNV
jgi:hypothetical protein